VLFPIHSVNIPCWDETGMAGSFHEKRREIKRTISEVKDACSYNPNLHSQHDMPINNFLIC
jgi:hypothetical protein